MYMYLEIIIIKLLKTKIIIFPTLNLKYLILFSHYRLLKIILLNLYKLIYFFFIRLSIILLKSLKTFTATIL